MPFNHVLVTGTFEPEFMPITTYTSQDHGLNGSFARTTEGTLQAGNGVDFFNSSADSDDDPHNNVSRSCFIFYD